MKSNFLLMSSPLALNVEEERSACPVSSQEDHTGSSVAETEDVGEEVPCTSTGTSTGTDTCNSLAYDEETTPETLDQLR
jgi:hypothetical protein